MTDIAPVLDAIRGNRDEADELLDALYPDPFRLFRGQHTTPVDVATRAAAWLAGAPGARVLDVGAGAGRFCVVGALTTGATFVGVEQRRRLVDAARDVAARLGATRAEFVRGDIREVDWARFGGFYLFNPFAENYLPRDERIDDEVAHAAARLVADIDFVEARLHAAPAGTRVVTWHGFGGLLEGYRCARREMLRRTVMECLVRE